MSFGGKLTELLNAAATSTALGVASRTGLLAALGPEPQTAAQLAASAGLAPRWVEETLATLVCGVTAQPTHHLPVLPHGSEL